MDNIIEKIKGIPNLYHGKGCTTGQIDDAQKALGLTFPEEFVSYVKEFGVISFYGTEWTGLNISRHLNVVEATNQEKKLNDNFPNGHFLIENHAIDGILAIANETGQVFTLQYDKINFLCESISKYLDICIDRKK